MCILCSVEGLRAGQTQEISELQVQIRAELRGTRWFYQLRAHGTDWPQRWTRVHLTPDETMAGMLAVLGFSEVFAHLDGLAKEHHQERIATALKR